MTADQLQRLHVLAREARSARLRLDRHLDNKPLFERTRGSLAQLRVVLTEIEEIVLAQ
jgi:hypothetical protein